MLKTPAPGALVRDDAPMVSVTTGAQYFRSHPHPVGWR